MAKILYIEDIQDNVTLVERIVTSRGHEFMSADNAEKGLEIMCMTSTLTLPGPALRARQMVTLLACAC